MADLFTKTTLNFSYPADLLGLMIMMSCLPHKKPKVKDVIAAVFVVTGCFLIRYYNYLMTSLFLSSFCLILLFYKKIALSNTVYLAFLYTLLVKIGRMILIGIIQPTSMIQPGFVVITVLCRWLILFGFRTYVPDIAFYKKTWPDYAILLISVAQMAFIQNFSRGSSPTDVMFTNWILSVICIGALGTIYSAIYRTRISQQEQELIQIEDSMQKQYAVIQSKKEADEEVARQYHDLQEQLSGLLALSDNQEIREAIHQLTGQLTSYECIYNTGNKTVDILLSEKTAYAKKNGLTLRVFMDFTAGDFLHHMDICALLGNALSNAIEAASLVTDPQKKNITIKSAVIHDFFIIKIQNYFVGKLKREGSRLLTTKSDEAIHGKGMASICYSAARYHGHCDYQVDGDLFTLEIIFPLHKQI